MGLTAEVRPPQPTPGAYPGARVPPGVKPNALSPTAGDPAPKKGKAPPLTHPGREKLGAYALLPAPPPNHQLPEPPPHKPPPPAPPQSFCEPVMAPPVTKPVGSVSGPPPANPVPLPAREAPQPAAPPALRLAAPPDVPQKLNTPRGAQEQLPKHRAPATPGVVAPSHAAAPPATCCPAPPPAPATSAGGAAKAPPPPGTAHPTAAAPAPEGEHAPLVTAGRPPSSGVAWAALPPPPTNMLRTPLGRGGSQPEMYAPPPPTAEGLVDTPAALLSEAPPPAPHACAYRPTAPVGTVKICTAPV